MGKKKYLVFVLFAGLLLLTACSKGESAKELYKNGNRYFKTGDYQKACEYYEKAIKKNSEKAEYYIDYGMALIKNGQITEAMIQFDKGILDKDNKIVRENNKIAYRGKGIGYFETSEYSKALEEFDKALKIKELSDLNMDILYYKSDAYQKLGDYENAMETLEEINNMKKGKDSIVLGKIAYIQQQLENYDEALKNYDKALELDKKNYELYFGKYNLLVNQGKNAEASEVLNSALAIKVKTNEDKYNLGKIYYLQGKYDEAVKELEGAIENGFNGAYYYMGTIKFEKENYKEAVSDFKKYIENEQNIKSGIVYSQISEALIKCNQYDEALKYINDGIKLNDSAVIKQLKYNEILVYESLLDFSNAYKKASEYIKNYPDDEDMKREYEFLQTRQKDNKDESDKNE